MDRFLSSQSAGFRIFCTLYLLQERASLWCGRVHNRRKRTCMLTTISRTFRHMQYDLEHEHTSAATASELSEQTAEQLLDASPIFFPGALFNWTSNSNCNSDNNSDSNSNHNNHHNHHNHSNHNDHNNLRSHFGSRLETVALPLFLCMTEDGRVQRATLQWRRRKATESGGCVRGGDSNSRPSAWSCCVAPQRAAERRPTGIEDRHQGQGGRGPRRSIRPRSGRSHSPPTKHGTQYYGLDDNDSVPELNGVRPAPLWEPLPQARHQRHCGIGFELVLDTAVPQRGRKVVEERMIVLMVSDWMVEQAVQETLEVQVARGARRRVRTTTTTCPRAGESPGNS